MTTKFEIGIDWRSKGIVCWDARPGDALNLLPTPMTYSAIGYRMPGALGGGNLPSVTLYGTRVFYQFAGTGLSDGLVLGQDAAMVVNDIAVLPSTTYSVGLWIVGATNFNGVPMIMRVKNQAGTVLFSTTFNTTMTLTRVSATGATDVSTSYIYIEVLKNSSAVSGEFNVTGVMVAAAGALPTGYNAGSSTDLYDNVTDHVTDAEWFLGIHTPYQDDADDSMLRVKLNNSDRRFSPEYSGSPMAGFLAPHRAVVARSNQAGAFRTHWTGWVESIQPSMGKFGERGAEIKAAGAMLFFEDVETTIPVQENRRTDEILADLLSEVQIAPPVMQSMLLGVTGYAELDSTTFLPNPVIPNVLSPGQTTLAYAADNWVQPPAPGDTKRGSFNVYRAIKDVVAAERGRFFFDRTGNATFWDRHHLLKRKYDSLTDPTFDDAMQGLSYEYAGLGEFKNDIMVTCHPRAVSPDGQELLWSLEQPVTISAGETRKLTVNYKDDSENRIGGKNVYLANVTFSEGSGSVRLTAGGNRAILEIVNSQSGGGNGSVSSEGKAVLQTCELRGTKITDFGTMEATAHDELSINLFGRRTLRMNLASIDKLDDAQTIADFERVRRAQPSGKVRTIILVSDAVQGGNQHSEQLQRTIGDLIRVKETQTAHDDTYFIIGEQQRLSHQGEYFETTWYLEPATDADWFVVDKSDLDEAVLAY